MAGLFLAGVGIFTAYVQARQWKRHPRLSAYGVFVGGILFAEGIMMAIREVV
jgi:hypothetical protein